MTVFIITSFYRVVKKLYHVSPYLFCFPHNIPIHRILCKKPPYNIRLFPVMHRINDPYIHVLQNIPHSLRIILLLSRVERKKRHIYCLSGKHFYLMPITSGHLPVVLLRLPFPHPVVQIASIINDSLRTCHQKRHTGIGRMERLQTRSKRQLIVLMERYTGSLNVLLLRIVSP